MRHSLVALAMALLVACGGDKSESLQPTSTPTPNSALVQPIDSLDSSRTIDVPEAPNEAAALLVESALDPVTGAAAVREILTRAGIPIINLDGVMLNDPAAPSKIDTQIYDFQIPLLAASLRDGQSVRLSNVAALAPDLVGVELPAAVLTEAMTAWMESAPEEPGNPEAFDAALVRELARALPDGVPSDRITLVSFLVLSADLYGNKGTYARGGAMPVSLLHAVGIGRAEAAVACPEDKYDPWDGIGFKGGKTLTDWLVNIFGEGSEASRVWGRAKKLDKVKDYSDLLNSTMARAALVAGMKVQVVNDASGRKLHVRHSSGGSDMNPVTFTATVRFETPWPGAKVRCGPMKDYTIPDNSPVSGIWVEWTIIGKYLETLDKKSSQAVKRGGGGGGATADDGTIKLRAETVPEKYCPNDRGLAVDHSKCGKGDIAVATSGARAELDLTRTPPIKIKDLLMGKSPVESTAKSLYKVLMDIVTDIVTSSTGSTSLVAVEYHARPDYTLTFEGIAHVRGNCGGLDLAVDGTMATTLELKPDEYNSGSFTADGVLDPIDPWSYLHPGQKCRITPKQPAISAELTEGGRLFIKLEDLESDSWSCTPGPSGNAWWWMTYQLAMLDYRADDEAHRGWLELTPNPPKDKSGTRERTFKAINQTLDCQTDTVTTKIKLETGG